MSKKTITVERRFFKDDSEWEYMLTQLGVDDREYDKTDEVTFSMNTNSIEINYILNEK